MKLYTGGAYQGKLAYLRGLLPEEQIAYCSTDNPVLDTSRPAVSGLHLWVWAVLAAGGDPAVELKKLLPHLRDKIILCDELGGGIVPLRREDRRWREAAGRVMQLLSAEAGEVTEFLAGIPRRLLSRRTVDFLRHGRTAENAAHRYCGSGDPPLSDEGRALLAGRRYPPADRYFSSPSKRALETLRLLYGPVEADVCPDLMECGFGEFEGHTHEELAGQPAYETWIWDETGDTAPPGGESRNAHTARAEAALSGILGKPFERAVVVSHGGTIVRMLSRLFPGERNFYGWQPEHGEGWRVVFENGGAVSVIPVNGLEDTP